jgi:lipopolysaccharide exporter
MVLARVVDRTLGLASTLVLARLLAPDDFGVIAMAMSIIAVLDLLRAFGLDVVLIQHQAPEPVHYNTAWTMNILVSATVATLLIALAQPASIFYREPDLVIVMMLLALSPLIESCRNIGIVDFRRNQEFDREFRFMLMARLTRFAVTMPLAFYLRNYWALVGGMLFGRLAEVALSYVVHRYRPSPSLAAWRELMGFSKWLLLKNLVQVLTNRSGDFVIGRLVGTRELGLFNVSTEIAAMPSSELAAPINRALLPGFARQASDPAALRKAFLNVVSMITLATLPVGIGLMLTAHLVVPILLGEKWVEAIPFVPILALNGLLMSLGSNTGSFLLGVGESRLVFRLAVLKLIVLAPSLMIGALHAGAIGAAWAYVASTFTVIPVSYAIILRRLDLGVTHLLVRLWRPVSGVAVMTACVHGLSTRLTVASETMEMIVQLLTLAATGAIAYVVTVLLLWNANRRPDGAERFVLDTARTQLQRFRSR